MTDLWAVLGLACIDPQFRQSMFGSGDLADKLGNFHFRLSHYELGEAIRWFQGADAQKLDDLLDQVGTIVWDRGICLTGIFPRSGYVPLTPANLYPLQEEKKKEVDKLVDELKKKYPFLAKKTGRADSSASSKVLQSQQPPKELADILRRVDPILRSEVERRLEGGNGKAAGGW